MIPAFSISLSLCLSFSLTTQNYLTKYKKKRTVNLIEYFSSSLISLILLFDYLYLNHLRL